MKTYKNLWQEYLSKDNYDLAVQNACRRKSSKKHRKQSKWLREHKDSEWNFFQKYASNFHNAHHTPIEIYDGIQRKKRTIIVPTMNEQVVHHMVVNVLKPIFMKGMYEHSYGSIPNRGGHKGKATIEKWIRNDARNVKYCLKMDIKKFFENIPHGILIAKFRKLISDDKFLDVIVEIINVQEVGIPLGFYTSQWIANWYLQDLDHYIKEQLNAKHYIRYMDDMVVFGSNKKQLHEIRKSVSWYLKTNLGLELKNNWQVFRFDYVKNGKHYGRDLDFMGFRFFRSKTILRRKLAYKMVRKANRISKKLLKTIYDCKQMLAYLGWLDYTDTYCMYKEKIKPNINFQYCKRRISHYERRKNNENIQSPVNRSANPC